MTKRVLLAVVLLFSGCVGAGTEPFEANSRTQVYDISGDEEAFIACMVEAVENHEDVRFHFPVHNVQWNRPPGKIIASAWWAQVIMYRLNAENGRLIAQTRDYPLLENVLYDAVGDAAFSCK